MTQMKTIKSIETTILEYSNALIKKDELIKNKKVEDLVDRVGEKNLTILLNLPKIERNSILKRMKRLKEIR